MLSSRQLFLGSAEAACYVNNCALHGSHPRPVFRHSARFRRASILSSLSEIEIAVTNSQNREAEAEAEAEADQVLSQCNGRLAAFAAATRTS